MLSTCTEGRGCEIHKEDPRATGGLETQPQLRDPWGYEKKWSLPGAFRASAPGRPPWSLQSPLTPISGLWLPELWDLLCEATQFLVLCDSIPTQLISHPEALWPKQGSKLHVGNNWSQEKMRGTRWPTQAASASEAVCTHSSRLSVAVGVGCLSICSPDRKGCWSHSLPSSAWLSWDPHSQELGTHS